MSVREIVYKHDGAYIYRSVERKLLEYSEYTFAHLGKVETSIALETLSELPLEYIREDILVVLEAEECSNEPLASALQTMIKSNPETDEEQWIDQADNVLSLINQEIPSLAEGFSAYFNRV